MSHANQTALVTGANSGLGFEAAAQLADAGWGKVILACRSVEKAEDARARLKARTGKDPFATLAIDTGEVDSAKLAVSDLIGRGEAIDFLLLNAAASRKEATLTGAGFEVTYASGLIGHHVLTLGLLERGALTDHARIVIAGSEGARGNMPGMRLHDIGQLAATHHEGDRAKTIESLFKLELPEQTRRFESANEYVTAKLIVVWWTAELATKLPPGMTVNCVSPGSNLSTAIMRDAPAAMKIVMVPMLKLFGGFMRLNGPVAAGARRYLDAAERADDDTGHFYATAHPKKLVGPVGLQKRFRQFFDPAGPQAAFDALVSMTGVGFPTVKPRPRATA